MRATPSRPDRRRAAGSDARFDPSSLDCSQTELNGGSNVQSRFHLAEKFVRPWKAGPELRGDVFQQQIMIGCAFDSESRMSPRLTGRLTTPQRNPGSRT